MARHERRTKTRRERRFRLGYADFRTRHPRGVARQKMIHRLIGRQLRDGRQHTVSIGSQHDDSLGHRPHIVFGSVRDKLDRVRSTAVLGKACIIEIELARFWIDHHIFQHGAETLGRRKNFRLCLWRKPDHLGITTAFEIEDGGVGPAMLVITDQRARRIGAKCCLACA